MHSNISECDAELEIPTKKIKLSPQETSRTREAILSKVLQKEIQQEINLRKEDLELIEGNIFVVRQKLIHLKQVLAAEYYRQKSVKGSLQYSPHPAVKDTFIGKCPAGFENPSLNTLPYNEVETSESHVFVKTESEPAQEDNSDNYVLSGSVDIKKLLDNDKLPCYIPPKVTNDNVVKPTEPRDLHSKKEIRITVGNVSKWLAPSESADATHKWTVYAKLAQTDLDIALFVKKVVFFLHKSYRPNDVIEIKYPPFKLTRRGWGEFPLKAQFHFKSPDNPPIDVMHHLKLDHIHTGFETFGAETSLSVWVYYPLENEVVTGKKKPTEGVVIKTENCTDVTNINEDQIPNKLNTYQHNIFENSDAISDISLSANIYSIGNDINTGFNFDFKPDHSCDSESVNSLFDEIKREELITPLITSFEDKYHGNHNFIKGIDQKETELNPCKNEILEEKPKFEGFSEINFNEFEREGLFVDECAVVGEEIVIDCDEAEDNSIVEDNKRLSLEELDTKDSLQPVNTNLETCENDILSTFFNSVESKPKVCPETSNVDSPKDHEGNSSIIETSLNSIIQQLGIDVDSSNENKSPHTSSIIETSLNSIIQQLGIDLNSSNTNSFYTEEVDPYKKTKDSEVSSVLQDQKLNQIIPKNSVEMIKGLTSNNTKKVQKNTEKKSMIITLQKENGQIILRKEAKVQKFKDSSPKKGLAAEKNITLSNNKSLINSNSIPVKHSPMLVDVKSQLSMKLLPNQTKNVKPESKCKILDISNSVQKKPVPRVSILKKVKTLSKEDSYKELSNCELAQQCPVQNTEIAVNWLMKKFPLVDARSSSVSFHTRHPYCAKDRDTFLNWPLGKQRAAEWMRAKTIGRVLNEIPHLQKWSTLEIFDWARVRCYTPIRNIPGYDGPTVEPSLNFIYRPKLDGITELLEQHKKLAEEDIVDVIRKSPIKEEVSSSVDESQAAGPSQDITNDIGTVLPLDPDLQGFSKFVNKCMMNIVGEKPSHEPLLPDVAYPAVERVLISVFSSISEELLRRSYNASWIRHCDNPPPEISTADVKAAILSRKEFDFLLPYRDNKGREQPSVISYFRK